MEFYKWKLHPALRMSWSFYVIATWYKNSRLLKNHKLHQFSSYNFWNSLQTFQVIVCQFCSECGAMHAALCTLLDREPTYYTFNAGGSIENLQISAWYILVYIFCILSTNRKKTRKLLAINICSISFGRSLSRISRIGGGDRAIKNKTEQ